MVRQRVYGLALYEDLNDHDGLRQDLALQTAVEKDQVLASASALCRFEQRTGRNEALRLHEVRVEPFMASYKRPPRRLILDFDATDDPVHGQQEGRFFHGYYDHYCFLPLYVFCGHQPRVSDLRPSRIMRPSTPGRCWPCWSSAFAMAEGEDHLARRQRLLPLAHACMV